MHFTDLSFLDDKTSGGTPIFIMAKGDNYPVNPKGLIIDNCIFTRQSRQSLDSSLSDTVSISHVDDLILFECDADGKEIIFGDTSDSSSAAVGNGFKNSGFETAFLASDWGWFDANTNRPAASAPAGFSLSTANKHSASQSLKIDGTATGFRDYNGFIRM